MVSFYADLPTVMGEASKNMSEKISKIKFEYPFTLAEFTRDENKMNERKKELKEILEKYKQAIENYERILKEMMK